MSDESKILPVDLGWMTINRELSTKSKKTTDRNARARQNNKDRMDAARRKMIEHFSGCCVESCVRHGCRDADPKFRWVLVDMEGNRVDTQGGRIARLAYQGFKGLRMYCVSCAWANGMVKRRGVARGDCGNSIHL